MAKVSRSKYKEYFAYYIDKFYFFRNYVCEEELEDYDKIISLYEQVSENLNETDFVAPYEYDTMLTDARKIFKTFDLTYNLHFEY